MRRRILATLTATAALVIASPALAQQQETDCGTVRLVQVNWTGVSAKTETAAWLLNQLGYDTDVITASVPIMFQSLATDERDVAFGLWLPTQRGMVRQYMTEGSVDMVATNLSGAKYTLAVPTYVYEAGVQHFDDLDEHKSQFGGEVYGIEAGNDGNQVVKNMIADDAYGLGDWELVPSSEAGMLSEVQRRVSNQEWIVYLGWAPHPMNLNIDMKFLNGGANYWGPNQGGATVHTLSSEGFAWKCPNVGQFLENYEYTVDEQSQMAAHVVNEDMGYAEAGQALIKSKPELLERWFGQGGAYQTGPVQNAEGDQDALPALRSALGL